MPRINEIKSRIALAKATFNKKFLSTSKSGLKFEDESSKKLHLQYSFVWCWNMGTSDSRSETLGKFWDVVLEEDEEDQLNLLCEKLSSSTQSPGGDKYRTNNEKKEG